jgi:hypothetical protein
MPPEDISILFRRYSQSPQSLAYSDFCRLFLPFLRPLEAPTTDYEIGEYALTFLRKHLEQLVTNEHLIQLKREKLFRKFSIEEVWQTLSSSAKPYLEARDLSKFIDIDVELVFHRLRAR